MLVFLGSGSRQFTYENCFKGSLKQRKKCCAGTDSVALCFSGSDFLLNWSCWMWLNPLSVFPPRKIRRKMVLSRSAGENQLVLAAYCLCRLAKHLFSHSCPSYEQEYSAVILAKPQCGHMCAYKDLCNSKWSPNSSWGASDPSVFQLSPVKMAWCLLCLHCLNCCFVRPAQCVWAIWRLLKKNLRVSVV